jgi:hypothetical protein
MYETISLIYVLVCLVCKYCPKIVLISETRQQRDRVRNIRVRMGMNNCFVVDGQGKVGRLALYWDDSIKIIILSYGLHHIDVIIWDGEHHARWHGTFVYGEPQHPRQTHDVEIVASN